jgi:hypothetical protein
VSRPPPISRPSEVGSNASGTRLADLSQLTECARAAVRTKETYLASHYAQLRYSVEHRDGLQRQFEALGYDVTLDKVEPEGQAA